jgi:hypothetical protein
MKNFELVFSMLVIFSMYLFYITVSSLFNIQPVIMTVLQK